MLPELQTLRELQRLDLRIARCDRELSGVPGALAGIDAAIGAARARLTATEAELEETGRERRRAEGALEDAEATVAKYGEQLLQARTNDEYKGLQQQIAARKKTIGDLEDRILALMDAGDRLDGQLVERRGEFEKRSAELEARKEAIRGEAAAQEGRRAAFRKERTAAAADLSGEVSARYERIRAARHGLAVARAKDDRCTACSVRLRPQLYEEIRVGKFILACESCARILFFEPEPAAPSA